MFRAALGGLCLCVLFSQEGRCQTWSAEQQEVWQTVESYWQCYAAGDAACFLTYLHDDFSGWTNTNAMPRDKGDMARYLPRGFETTETVLHDVTPVGITVHSNVAVVHYYYTRTFVDRSGAQHGDSGRWTDVLLRQGNRWVMIGDHGGSDGGD